LSGNGKDGTLQADTHWVPGKFGSCLAFDGTGDYVNCSAGNWGAHFTKIIWTKSYVTETDYVVMGGDAYGSWRLQRSQLYGAMNYYDWGLTGGGNVTSNYLMTTNNKYEWTQVAITYDGAVVKIYINGLWSASSAATSGTPNADAMYLGRKNNEYWYGLLDNSANYNRALSASEIALLYRETFCMFERLISPGLLYAPSGVDVTVEPAALALSAELHTPTLAYDYTVTPSALALALALQTPTVIAGAGWIGINSSHIDSFCGEGPAHTLADALNGDDYWEHSVAETHWVIIDLGIQWNVTKVKGRSNLGADPTNVNIYVSNSKEDWGEAVASGIDTWQDTTEWVEIDTIDKNGRYVKVEISSTETLNWLSFGATPAFTIFDVYVQQIFDVTVTPSTLALALALQAPTLAFDYTVTPSTLALATVLLSPDVSGSALITPLALALALTLEAPSLHSSFTATPDALGLGLKLEAPSILFPLQTILPAALNLSLDVLSPLIKVPGIFSVAAPEGELASMISRAVPKISENPSQMRTEIQKILRQHFQDIQTLFAMTTDCDRYEKLQRDNEGL